MLAAWCLCYRRSGIEAALKADVFINVPIAKHHGMSGLTMSLKNVMGVAGGNAVAVDACATRFFGKVPSDIPHLVLAAERGLGTLDLVKLAVREESL